MLPLVIMTAISLRILRMESKQVILIQKPRNLCKNGSVQMVVKTSISVGVRLFKRSKCLIQHGTSCFYFAVQK